MPRFKTLCSRSRRVYQAAPMILVAVWGTWVGLGATAAQPLGGLRQHVPRFQWQTGPSRQWWIYDGPLPVGAFYAGTEPMRSIARPISLHNLRLLPGGPVFIRSGEGCGPLCLSWRKHLIFKMAIDAVRADDSDPERFKLYVKSHDVALRKDQPADPPYRPNNFVEQTWLELTYDRDLPSYRLDVRTRLTVNPGRRELILPRDFGGLEFGDLLPAGANDRFAPHGRKRFPWLVYLGRDGRRYKLPQTHHLNQRHIRYARDGFLAFVAEPDYNPVIRFIGDSGLDVRSEVCWAMYDVHFKFIRDRQLQRLEAGRPLDVHYQVYSIPEATARRWLADAELDPILEESRFRLPAFFPDRLNRFEPSDEYRVPSDYWFWRKTSEECRWVWDVGFQSRGSLSIHRVTPGGQAAWEFTLIGPSWFPGFRFDGRHCMRARVRTRDVSGDTHLVWQPTTPRREPVVSRALRGTCDWTLVEMEIPDMPGMRQAAIRFIQNGSGQSWLDDLEIVPIPTSEETTK